MSPRTIGEQILLDVPPLHTGDTVADAVRRLRDAELPALPVVDRQDRYAGIFGEREFMTALFPGYVGQLRGSAFLTHSVDAALEKRDACRFETIGKHLTTEHVDVGPDYSDVQLAEIFLHHRVLIVPVVDDGRVAGILTRSAFFRQLAGRFLDG